VVHRDVAVWGRGRIVPAATDGRVQVPVHEYFKFKKKIDFSRSTNFKLLIRIQRNSINKPCAPSSWYSCTKKNIIAFHYSIFFPPAFFVCFFFKETYTQFPGRYTGVTHWSVFLQLSSMCSLLSVKVQTHGVECITLFAKII